MENRYMLGGQTLEAGMSVRIVDDIEDLDECSKKWLGKVVCINKIDNNDSLYPLELIDDDGDTCWFKLSELLPVDGLPEQEMEIPDDEAILSFMMSDT